MRWSAALDAKDAINAKNFFYPPLGFGDNSNSVASTLITAMGLTEQQLPRVPFLRIVPGVSTLLLDAPEVVFLQQKWGILPSVQGSARALDQQSSVNNPDGSVTIFTTYKDGTTAISHYTPNGFEEAPYGVDGSQIGKVSAFSSGTGKVSVNLSGQVGEVNLTNATVNIAPDATVAFTGSLSQIYPGNNSTVQATVFNSTITTSSGVKLTTLGTNDNVLINGNNNLVQNSANLSTIATGSGLNNSLANLGSNNNLILGTGTTVDMLGNNNTVIGRVPSGSVFDQGTGIKVLVLKTCLLMWGSMSPAAPDLRPPLVWTILLISSLGGSTVGISMTHFFPQTLILRAEAEAVDSVLTRSSMDIRLSSAEISQKLPETATIVWKVVLALTGSSQATAITIFQRQESQILSRSAMGTTISVQVG